MTAPALLHIDRLSVTFAGSPRPAVDNVSVQVAAGERVGIVGESGSGKSTTALAALRLLNETQVGYGSESRIEVGGRDILRLAESELTELRGSTASMVFQDPSSSLNPVFKAGHQVRDVIAAHRPGKRADHRTAALEALTAAGIPDAERVYGCYPFQLSGGLRQRVVIAMAIACSPALLVADEPTSALDATVQAEVLATFDRLCRERGTSLLLISHDIGVVARMCERVYVMSQGVVVEHGSTDSVINRPEHEYTRTLVAAARHREGRTRQTRLTK
ncbi:ABC transporter ATP-binding protein [Nakamurella lactea]|uniref:ABC transporter ATP-binding protein n=1 Tax=Nakamurella lactea TaxID=459515 RepID=UPI00040FA57E|nr:ABC transporter ATP-binding protein [Nakamurella lactea]